MARIDQYSTRQPSRTDILLGTDEPTGRTSNFSLADLEDFLLMNKGDRKIPIEQRIDLTSSEPENPVDGGRYLNTVTGTSSITSTAVVEDYIYELRAGEWFELIPVEGFTLWDKGAKENITYAGTGYGWVANTVSGAQLTSGLDSVNNSLDQNFTFDENGNITGFSEAFTSTVNTTVAGEGFATAQSVSQVGANLNTLTDSFNTKVTNDATAFAGIPHTFKQDDAPTDSDPKFIRNSVWYDTNDGNKAYVLEPQSETPNAPLVWVEATDERLGQLITEVGSQKNILIDTNGHVSGMTMGNFGPDKSYISFLADRFKIYTYDEDTAGGSVSNPFVVENGIVKISQLATRDITVGDVPPEAQSTVIFATTSNGANASTSKFDTDSGGNVTLTRTHVFLANTRWVNGDSLDNSWVFERIAGVNGTSVNIEGSVNDVASLPTTGNSPGDGYLISGNLYVWDGSQWNNAGNIQGPEGNDGITPSFGLDYQNGVDGSFHSYIYKVSDTQPARPPSTGTAFYQGSFDGISEIIPDGWTDSPSVSTEDVEWVSKAIYENTKTYHPTTGAETTTWTKRTTSGHDWSEPVKIYQKGDVGDTGTPGADAYTVVLANESHTVPVSAVSVHNYAGSGTSIVAYKGGTQLQGRVSGTPGAGQFTVTPNASGIGIDGSPSVPSGSMQVTIPDMRDMTNNTASVTYSINLEDNITITKKQTFTKSQDGQPGQNGSPGESVTGTPGSPGKKTATGLIFYQVSSTNAPSLPIAGNASFDFTDGSVSGLTSNWNTVTPSLGPGTSTSTFWSSRYYAVETNANSNIGSLTFDTPVSMYSFDQVVTFNALGATGSTTIDGGNITTGTIKSENHSGNSTGSAMSNAGTSFNLTTGAISSENFRIDASGNSEFSGTMKIGGNTLTEKNTFNSDDTSASSVIANTTFQVAAADGRPAGVKSSHASGALRNRIKYSSDGQLELSGQASVGACFPAFKINKGTKYNISVRLSQEVDASSGLYMRMQELDGELPSGKTHIVGGSSSNEEEGVVEYTRQRTSHQDMKINGVGVSSLNNVAVKQDSRDIEFTYVPTSTAKYVSLNILNWSGAGNTAMYIERVYATPVTVDAVTLLGIAPNMRIEHEPPTTESTGLIYPFQSKVAGPAQLKLVVYDAEATGSYPNYHGIQASVNGNPLKTRLNRGDVGGANQTNNTYFDTVQVVSGSNSLNVWSNTDDDGGRLIEAEIVYIQTDDKESGTVGGWTVDSNSIYSGNKDTNGFKSDGGITLSSAGSIHAKDFYIDTSGNANFRGTMTIGGTDLDAQNTFNSNTSKSDVGLGNVDNTSDQALKNSLNKGDVGLGNVDNTSDSTLLSNAGVNSNNQEKTAGKIGGWTVDSTAIYSGSKDTNGFADNGGFTLSSSGSLHSKEFYIDTNGNANFKGSIELASGQSGARGSQLISLEAGQGNIRLSHDAATGTTYAEGELPPGSVTIDSKGIELDNAGIEISAGGYGNHNAALYAHGRYDKSDSASIHVDGARFIAGAYFTAENNISGYSDSRTPTPSFGAVIERLKVYGLIKFSQKSASTGSATNPRNIYSTTCLYVASNNSGTAYLSLPTDVRRGQVIKVHAINAGKARVYSGFTTTGVQNLSGHNDNRDFNSNVNKIYHDGYNSYVDVPARHTRTFYWNGSNWHLI